MNENSSSDVAIQQVQAIATLPPEIAIMKMENENIIALAAARPRDYKQIIADLRAQIEAYPSFAREGIYSKPVGKGEDGKMKYARGLSIRAAEAIREAYGYNRVRADVTVIDDNTVKIEATFSDYQRGSIWQDASILSKFYRSSRGQTVRYSDDRFFNLVVKAEKSKCIREVILRSVPPGLRSELEELIERQIDNLLDDAYLTKAIAMFADKGVTQEMLEEHLGKTLKAGWTKDDRRNLVGVWNAIKDGETTVEEAFGKAREAQRDNGGAVQATDLVTPKLAEQPREEPTEAQPVDGDNGDDAYGKMREQLLTEFPKASEVASAWTIVKARVGSRRDIDDLLAATTQMAKDKAMPMLAALLRYLREQKVAA